MGQAATRLRKMARVRAAVQESPLAKRVTSCPRRTSSSVRLGNNSFRSAIETRRAAFGEGGNLCNFHRRSRFGVRRQTGKSTPPSSEEQSWSGNCRRMEFPSWISADPALALAASSAQSAEQVPEANAASSRPWRSWSASAAKPSDESIDFYEETASAGNQSPARLVTARLTNCHGEERYT